MADLATRLLERQRPVPTGNVLQTQPIACSVFPLPKAAQSHKSSYSKLGMSQLLSRVFETWNSTDQPSDPPVLKYAHDS
jgi:hypothetical protein